jgi:hypothetical protein
MEYDTFNNSFWDLFFQNKFNNKSFDNLSIYDDRKPISVLILEPETQPLDRTVHADVHFYPSLPKNIGIISVFENNILIKKFLYSDIFNLIEKN